MTERKDDKPARRFQPFEKGRDENPTTQPRTAKPSQHSDGADEAWLADAPARSASILARLGATPEPGPEPEPIPPSGGSVGDLVTTPKQLRDALNTYASEKRVGVFDGRSYVRLDSTIEIQQQSNDGTPWGVNGGYAHIDWVGPGGDDMIRYRGKKDMANRCLVVEKLSLFGNGYSGNPCGACLKLYAPEGDPGSIYKFTLRDVFTSYGSEGIVIEGAVFEGMGENLHCENHRSHGLAMRHTYTPGEHQGIVSNIMLMHPNMSRNMGAGILAVNSVNILFGSFVLNALGGVLAPEGLRVFGASNGENTGESLLVVGTPGWGSQINGNEASSDGQTHARAYEGGQWVSKGKPLLYLLDDGGTGVPEEFNHMSYYGDGTNQDKIATVKPQGKR